MLRVFARRRLDQRAHQPLGKAHAVTLRIGFRVLDVGAGLFPHPDGFFVLIEVDSGFLQHGFRIALDQLELLVAEGLIGLDLAPDVTGGRCDLIGARRPAGIGPAGASLAASGGSGLYIGHGLAC